MCEREKPEIWSHSICAHSAKFISQLLAEQYEKWQLSHKGWDVFSFKYIGEPVWSGLWGSLKVQSTIILKPEKQFGEIQSMLCKNIRHFNLFLYCYVSFFM